MKIPKANIERLCMEEGDSRYALHCVYLDATNQRIISTNGHALVRRTVELDEGDVNALIPKEVLTYARSVNATSILSSDKVLTVMRKDEKLAKFPRIEGKFPSADEFFSFSGEPMFFFNFNALKEAVQAMKSACLIFDDDGEEISPDDLNMIVGLWLGADETKQALLAPIGKKGNCWDMDGECVSVVMPCQRDGKTFPAEEVLQRGQVLNAATTK